MKIFRSVLGLLPPGVPLAIIGVLLLALAAGAYSLYRSIKALGAAEVLATTREAIIKQKERDAALSAELVQRQAVELRALRNRAQTIITRIEHVPVTTGCGPVMRDASRGLHELFTDAGGSQPGRKPAAAVR